MDNTTASLENKNLNEESNQQDKGIKLATSIPLSEAKKAPNSINSSIFIKTALPGEKFLTGKIAEVEDLPPALYHVSPHKSAIQLSKKIIIPKSSNKDGIGGDFFKKKDKGSTSFTETKAVAENIKNNLIDVIKSSKGELTNKDLTTITKRDEHKYGLSEGSLEAATTEATKQYDFKISDGASKSEAMVSAIRTYFRQRDSLSGDPTPSIYGSVDVLSTLEPTEVEIFEIPRENLFKSGSLVRHELTPENKKLYAEVVVHGDVPID